MSVWDKLVSQSEEVLSNAAGTALDGYAKSLSRSQPTTTPTPSTPAATPTAASAAGNKKWFIIGGIAVAALLGWLILRKK